jgi:hypothetical protein
MDRQRPLENAVRTREARVVALSLWVALCALGSPRLQAQTPGPPVPKSSSADAEPVERRPYRIFLHVGFDPSARIDEAKGAALIRDWQVLARRFVGAPWVVTVADPNSPLAIVELDSLEPGAFAGLASFDKVWVMRIAQEEPGSGLVLSGREYDTATQRLGPLQLRVVAARSDAPRAMLEFTRDLFNPTAVISGQEGGRALLTVQGAMIAPASSFGAVVEKGTVFQPLRLVSLANGKIEIVPIKHTYLQVESVEGPVARCTITSAYSDPLSKRMARPNSFVAVGLKPGNSPITLRFVTGTDLAPAAGYTLTARLVPDGQPREIGMTDRAGRIVLKPGFARGLVILRLLAGNVEPIVELPLMPGESADNRPISVDPKVLTVALEAQIDSIRDEVVDLVALRARLESRMKARLEGEDWSALEAELKEFAQLTPHDQFAQRLAQLKDDAAHRQAETKTAILTKTAQAQIADLQAMIDRYLEDETYRAYLEALEKGKGEVAAKKKAQAKKAATRPALVPPSDTSGDSGARPSRSATAPAKEAGTVKKKAQPDPSPAPF